MKNPITTPLTSLTTIAAVALVSYTQAEIPETGIVVEGVLVPGIQLGDTRDLIELQHGSPINDGDDATEAIYLVGRGSVTIDYSAANGSAASGNADDVAGLISWSDIPGWTTTAELTSERVSTVISDFTSLYPETFVRSLDSSSTSSEFFAYSSGIGGFTTFQKTIGRIVRLQIFEATPTPEEGVIYTSLITARESSGTIRVHVFPTDLFSRVIGGTAEVTLRYDSPQGTSILTTDTASGFAEFRIPSASGTHTFTVLDVVGEGYRYEADLNTTIAGINLVSNNTTSIEIAQASRPTKAERRAERRNRRNRR